MIPIKFLFGTFLILNAPYINYMEKNIHISKYKLANLFTTILIKLYFSGSFQNF